MRQIEVEAGLRLRFPHQSADFDDGVEIGIAAALMAAGAGPFSRPVSSGNLPQLQALAERLGWHLVPGPSEAGQTEARFQRGRPRVVLTLVQTATPEAVRPPPIVRSGARPTLSIARPVGAQEHADRLQASQAGRVS